MASSDELRVMNDELWYAFLYRKTLIFLEEIMTIKNKSVVKQYLQSLFTIHYSLFTEKFQRNFS